MSRAPFVLLTAVLLVALPCVRASAAGDARPVELPLLSGQSVTGSVESADAKEVVVRVGAEETRRIPWAQLRPLGVYRAKAALAPPADGQARLSLAELAVELGLYAEARVEYEKALALGAIDKQVFQGVVTKAEQDAVQVGVKMAEKQADAGDYEGALETARNLKLQFGAAPNAVAIDRLLAELVQRVGALQKAAAKDAAELARIQVEAERDKEILRRKTKATGEIDLGRSVAKKAADARQIGNVSRARKYADSADAAFMDARRDLGRLRRILRPNDPRYREVISMLNDLDAAQFRLLYDSAEFFWQGRIYSAAEEFAARASYIDPVNPDLLELREMLRAARIRYRLSDVTNAHGRVTSGSGAIGPTR